MTDATTTHPPQIHVPDLDHLKANTVLNARIVSACFMDDKHAIEALIALDKLKHAIACSRRRKSYPELRRLRRHMRRELTAGRLRDIMDESTLTQTADPSPMRRACPDWSSVDQQRLIQLRNVLHAHIS
jgi:hypothetical protein